MPDRIAVRSLRTGGIDYIEVPTAEETHRAALLREREGYLRRGLTDRAAQVDEALRALGPEPADEPADEPAEGVAPTPAIPSAAPTTTRTGNGRRPHRR